MSLLLVVHLQLDQVVKWRIFDVIDALCCLWLQRCLTLDQRMINRFRDFSSHRGSHRAWIVQSRSSMIKYLHFFLLWQRVFILHWVTLDQILVGNALSLYYFLHPTLESAILTFNVAHAILRDRWWCIAFGHDCQLRWQFHLCELFDSVAATLRLEHLHWLDQSFLAGGHADFAAVFRLNGGVWWCRWLVLLALHGLPFSLLSIVFVRLIWLF